MTVVSDDPIWWPSIDSNFSFRCFVVASSVIAIYNWALTFSQEVDMIWKRRWSFMTLLYLSVRYIGILCSIIMVLTVIPGNLLTDTGCTTVFQAQLWANDVVHAILCVIIIVRLHAMYQHSRKILVFLIVTFLGFVIATGVVMAIISVRVSGEMLVLSGTYQCSYWGYSPSLTSAMWIFGTIFESLAMCLASWIAVKHFHEVRQRSTRWAIGDCLTVLIKSHVFYFAGFAGAAVLGLFPKIGTCNSSIDICDGLRSVAMSVQMFVLGPRLILSVRICHAEAVVDFDAELTGMTTIAFTPIDV